MSYEGSVLFTGGIDGLDGYTQSVAGNITRGWLQ